MHQLSEIFELKREGLNLSRAFFLLCASLVLLIVSLAIKQEVYLLSAWFAFLCVGLSDPGGEFVHRALLLVAFALVGASLTALAFGIGSGPWGWVVLAAFMVTLLAGLAVKYGVHRFVGAMLLNVWFIVALAVPNSYSAAKITSHTWGQALAWLIGSAVWIAFIFVVWLARGRKDAPAPVPEIPGDTATRELTPPLIAYAAIRALAVAIAIAIPFGFNLPNAAWAPVAALVAMKGDLNQTTLVGEQRIVGALIGALVAAVLLLTVDNKHVLEAAVIVFFTIGVAIHGVNYTLYTAAIAATVLIALDVPHPSNVSAEGQRVLYTLLGVGIGVVVFLLAGLLSKRAAKAHEPASSQPEPA
jgi:Fusaric acid resistance protein-like